MWHQPEEAFVVEGAVLEVTPDALFSVRRPSQLVPGGDLPFCWSSGSTGWPDFGLASKKRGRYGSCSVILCPPLRKVSLFAVMIISILSKTTKLPFSF